MISSIIKPETILPKNFDQKTGSLNYKELYLQCKKNVALFMKQVQKEISDILKNHQDEKKQLKSEIQGLKNQINMKNQSPLITIHNQSFRSITHKKHNSQHKERNHTSVSKEAVDQCLAKFTGLNLNTLTSQRRSQNQMSFLQQRRSVRKREEEKQNLFLPTNLTLDNDLNISSLKMSTMPRRDKRYKQKKVGQSVEKAQNIKDFLKNIRGSLNSKEKNMKYARQKEQEERKIIKIISPEMFSSRTNNV